MLTSKKDLVLLLSKKMTGVQWPQSRLVRIFHISGFLIKMNQSLKTVSVSAGLTGNPKTR